MTPKNSGDMENDPRSIDELINTALITENDEERWLMIAGLHWKGTIEVVRRAEKLSESSCKHERMLAADMVAQLGVAQRTFKLEVGALLRSMLGNESDEDVQYSILVALSHQSDEAAIPQIVPFSRNADPDLRYACALALSGLNSKTASDSLIELTRDSEPKVRDWACCGIGWQLEADTPEVRQALVDRLDDEDLYTRMEALEGLARRCDPRAFTAIRRELKRPEVHPYVFDAAAISKLPELLPDLIRARERSDIDQDELEKAIEACSDTSNS